MKKTIAFLSMLSAVIAVSAHADAALYVKGKEARALEAALENVMGRSGCAIMGSGRKECEIAARNVSCKESGIADRSKGSYSCTLVPMRVDEEGIMEETREIAAGPRMAEALAKALNDAGVEGDCGASSCYYESSSVSCNVEFGPGGEKSYSCAVYPAHI